MTISDTLLTRLKNCNLVVEAGVIGDQWRKQSASGATFPIVNPSTGDILARVPDFSRQEASQAIETWVSPA